MSLNISHLTHAECRTALKVYRDHVEALNVFVEVVRATNKELVTFLVTNKCDVKPTNERLNAAGAALSTANQTISQAITTKGIEPLFDETSRFLTGWKHMKELRSKDDNLEMSKLISDEEMVSEQASAVEEENKRLQEQVATAVAHAERVKRELCEIVLGKQNLQYEYDATLRRLHEMKKECYVRASTMRKLLVEERVDARGEEDLARLINEAMKQVDATIDMLREMFPREKFETAATARTAAARPPASTEATVLSFAVGDESAREAPTRGGGHDETARDMTAWTSMHTREETSKSKLDASTPVFGKDSQWKIADWLFMVETSLKVKRIPDDMKLMVVAPFLRGTAFQMLKRFMLEKRTSWNEFRNELLTAFQPPDHARIMRTRLLNLRQGESFQKYSRDFQYLVTQIVGMSEEDKLACFMQGLRARTRVELVYKKVSTLTEAVTLASSLELARNDGSNQRAHSEEREFGAKNKGQSHFKFRHENGTAKSGQAKCFKCNKTGHFANKCRSSENSKNNNSSNSDNKSSGQKKESKDILCWNCGKRGHKTADCR